MMLSFFCAWPRARTFAFAAAELVAVHENPRFHGRHGSGGSDQRQKCVEVEDFQLLTSFRFFPAVRRLGCFP